MTDNMSADRWIGYIFTEHSSIVGINAGKYYNSDPTSRISNFSIGFTEEP